MIARTIKTCYQFHGNLVLFLTNNFCFLDILAISTYDYKMIMEYDKRAYSINPRGGYQKVDFEFGKETEVFQSCSLQWQNRYYVFGGFHKQRQVSLVSGNRLERKGSLDFDFKFGGCTVLNQITIVLCFSDVMGQFDVCRQSNNPLGSFNKLPNSNYEHFGTTIASFDGKSTIY